MDQNARIGQRQTFLRLPRRQQQRRHRRRLPDANRRHVILYILHRVVDRHPRRDRTARRVDVELDVLFRIFLRQKQHLRDDQVGDVVVYRRANKDDIVAEQTGVNVIGSLAAPGLLDYHRNQHHFWIAQVSLPHSCPEITEIRGGSKWSACRLMRTGDTENRGSSRCGFCFGFYRGPHPVSNDYALPQPSVLFVLPAPPPPARFPPR